MSFSCKTQDLLKEIFYNFQIFKKKDWPLEKFTANYNWKYVFKSKKTDKEASNDISLIKLSVLQIPSIFSEFGSRDSRLTNQTSFHTDTYNSLNCLATYNLYVLIA